MNTIMACRKFSRPTKLRSICSNASPVDIKYCARVQHYTQSINETQTFAVRNVIKHLLSFVRRFNLADDGHCCKMFFHVHDSLDGRYPRVVRMQINIRYYLIASANNKLYNKLHNFEQYRHTFLRRSYSRRTDNPS